jgi:hypothetical protein
MLVDPLGVRVGIIHKQGKDKQRTRCHSTTPATARVSATMPEA